MAFQKPFPTVIAFALVAALAACYLPSQAGVPGGPNVIPHDSDQFAGPRAAAIAPLKYFNDRAGSIYAGSNEIQRNIIAKAGLGL